MLDFGGVYPVAFLNKIIVLCVHLDAVSHWQLGRSFQVAGSSKYTLPETNIAPKIGWLEYYFPIEKAYFQGLC